MDTLSEGIFAVKEIVFIIKFWLIYSNQTLKYASGSNLRFDSFEEVPLFELLVFDDLQVHVVGVLSGPLQEGLVGVGDWVKLDLALDARYVDCRLGLHHFVANRKVFVWYFSDWDFPLGTILVGEGHEGTNLAWAAGGLKRNRFEDVWREVCEGKSSYFCPHGLYGKWYNTRLGLSATCRYVRSFHRTYY